MGKKHLVDNPAVQARLAAVQEYFAEEDKEYAALKFGGPCPICRTTLGGGALSNTGWYEYICDKGHIIPFKPETDAAFLRSLGTHAAATRPPVRQQQFPF